MRSAGVGPLDVIGRSNGIPANFDLMPVAMPGFFCV